MSSLRKNVASQHIGFCLNNTSTGAPVTGGGAGNVVIDGGAQAACAGTFTHKGSGQWDYAPTQAETNGTNISFAFTGTSAIQVGMTFYTLNYDTTAAIVPANVTQALGNPVTTATNGILDVNTKNKNNAAALSDPTNFNLLSIDGSGNVAITSNVKKNAASRLIFVMTDSTTHNPKTGLTVTSQRSIDGGALASAANSVTEISNGLYTLVLASADTNGNDINYRFTATGADDLNIEFVTQP